jgi:hypothetical protein
MSAGWQSAGQLLAPGRFIVKRYGLALVCALLGATPVFAAEVDVGGTYKVNGKNLDGSAYEGQAEIVVTTENTCRITWKNGSSVQHGICMRNGAAFSAAYAFSDGTVGLIIYELGDDGSMKGLWTIADKKGVGEENLTPAS